ncbi:Pol polyprotein [Plakobranchus ocellatus]|uniref:Pol polyprotein n=1 Tax=Plakobranchus ocellatus TaxID=259542 RepID=A0AAV4DWR0_9GAST|nr:Pol polyprotein [Plakobranchus ocellatus]
MLTHLLRFNFTLKYTKGINLVVADALSRSPVNPQAIDTVQMLLEEDIEAYLDYVELALGRKIRTTLPMLPYKLELKPQNQTEIKKHIDDHQQAVKKNFDRAHSARCLPQLLPDDSVVVKLDDDNDWSVPGRIKGKLHKPRFYLVDTRKGILRRNQKHLKKAPTLPWQPERPPYQFLGPIPDPGSTLKVPEATTSARPNATTQDSPPVPSPQKEKMVIKQGLAM